MHGGPPGSPRLGGPEHLIRFDAAFAVMLAANEARIGELRERGDKHDGNRDVMFRAVHDLNADAERIACDDAAWGPARLTVDGEPVEAIGLTYEGWPLILHVGTSAIADIYVYGPPRAFTEPLALSRVSAAAYP
ncbi:MAG TPA: hypothetical protein VGG41_19705 [Solirubrobacteraceae bacterium]|jgi:hypothetical protein